MIIKNKLDFIEKIKSFNIDTEYVIIKPNWVSNIKGEYTEPEIFSWFLESLNKNQKKIIIESYTPWRGLVFHSKNKKEELKTDLIEGKKHWDFYKKQDRFFLKTTGINNVLKKYQVDYINITNEFWKESCINPKLIKKIVEKNNKKIFWKDFFSYIPEQIYKIKNKATFVSLAKIKLETEHEKIVVSFSIKNLFGLIPHPSRHEPFHNNNDKLIPQTIADIFNIYNSLFKKTLWINEGIKTLVKNYRLKNQSYEYNKNLLFIERSGLKADINTCKYFSIDPNKVPYLKILGINKKISCYNNKKMRW